VPRQTHLLSLYHHFPPFPQIYNTVGLIYVILICIVFLESLHFFQLWGTAHINVVTVLFFQVRHSEFPTLTCSISKMIVFEKNSCESNMMFLEPTLVPHVYQLWNKTNTMFLECTVMPTSLYWWLPLQSYLLPHTSQVWNVSWVVDVRVRHIVQYDCLSEKTPPLTVHFCHWVKNAGEKIGVLLCGNSKGINRWVPNVVGKSLNHLL